MVNKTAMGTLWMLKITKIDGIARHGQMNQDIFMEYPTHHDEMVESCALKPSMMRRRLCKIADQIVNPTNWIRQFVHQGNKDAFVFGLNGICRFNLLNALG
jgi:hypothetical protein